MPSFTCACGAKYRFQEESVGRKAKCKKCGEVITLETPDAGIIPFADDGIIPLANDDPMAGDRAHGHANEGGASNADIPPPPPPPGFTPPKVIIEKPERVRTYASDLIETLYYMFRIQNLPTFLMVWFMLVLAKIVLPWAPIFGLLGMLIITGWYCAFRFDVVREAAGGESSLPELSLTEGWIDGIIVPFLCWIGSWLIVMIPAVIGLALDVGLANVGASSFLGGIGGQIGAGIGNQAWLFLGGLALGLFLWPIIILCFALGGVSSLSRLDLIVETTLKTFPVYFLTVLIVYASVIAEPILGGLGEGFIGAGVLVAVGLYLDLVSLRAIGLYYHHFKHKFRWSWG